MLPEQHPQSYERDMRIIAIKDAFVAVGQSVIWSEVGMLTQSKDIIGSNDRLERSQHWGDNDYDGHALNVLEGIVNRDPLNETKLIGYILPRLSQTEHDQAVLDRLRKIADYLEVIRVIGADDLSEHPHLTAHINRIEQALIEDPEVAIGSCKDLVESALKTFLDTPADELKGYTLPKLAKAARVQLSQEQSELKHDEDMLKMLSNFGQILESIATVRNKYGTGHGRAPWETFELPQPYVVLAANAAISTAVFLTQMHDLKSAEPENPFMAVDSPSNVDEGEVLPW